MEKQTISPKAFATAFGLGTAFKFAVSVTILLFFVLWVCEQAGADGQKKTFFTMLLIVLYLFFAIAQGNKFEATARQKRRVQALEEEKQSLLTASAAYSEKTQTLLEEKQTLSEKLQTLESQFSDLSIRNAELERSLESEKANATKRIEQAQADAEERALKEVAPYMEKAKTLENRAKTAETRLALMEEAICLLYTSDAADE